jgi:hypothetical protein
MMVAAGFGSAVSAQSEGPLDPMGANYWTGTLTHIKDTYSVGSQTSSEGVQEILGSSTRWEVAADDPRIAGTMTQLWNYRSAHIQEPANGWAGFSNGTVRIDNDQGAWLGTYMEYSGAPRQEEWFVVEGEGPYEGLTSVFRWHSADDSLEGVIVAAELPALPDPVAPPAE